MFHGAQFEKLFISLKSQFAFFLYCKPNIYFSILQAILSTSNFVTSWWVEVHKIEYIFEWFLKNRRSFDHESWAAHRYSHGQYLQKEFCMDLRIWCYSNLLLPRKPTTINQKNKKTIMMISLFFLFFKGVGSKNQILEALSTKN